MIVIGMTSNGIIDWNEQFFRRLFNDQVRAVNMTALIFAQFCFDVFSVFVKGE